MDAAVHKFPMARNPHQPRNGSMDLVVKYAVVFDVIGRNGLGKSTLLKILGYS